MLAWDGSAIAATAAERSSADGLTPQHWKVPGSVEVDISTAIIDLRLADGETERSAAAEVSEAALFGAIPWRTFRWYKGQRHYSGSYWAATEDNHVIYESRLELSSLLMADFDVSVLEIAAQPFLVQAVVNGRLRRHIPDFLWRTTTGLVVVDVVRRERLAESPKIQVLCAWTREVIAGLGWDYRVVSEQPAALLGNVRFLAGYRRKRYISPDALQQIRCRRDDLAGRRIDDAESVLGTAVALPVMRNALLHALWTQEFWVDLDRPLRPSSVMGLPR
ncbi:TnsA-like heteromeric transposase endonuclease subunit [Mycolicibacterium sp. jd]|uniref:TnsA-like heteromeric transposase endonuclease subunit n=1 Tax=unclassified Mycolicibacterium TaxID=2636767 RepID=UPI00351B62F8